MSFLFGGIKPPAPPPPPPNPPTMASPAVIEAQTAARMAAAAASGQGGFDRTLKSGAEGAPQPYTATKTLLGGGGSLGG